MRELSGCFGGAYLYFTTDTIRFNLQNLYIKVFYYILIYLVQGGVCVPQRERGVQECLKGVLSSYGSGTEFREGQT